MSDQIDVNAIADVLNNKMDLDMGNLAPNIDYVIDYQKPTSANNYTWYRLYRSGWIEQGGIQIVNDDNNSYAITFPKTMLDTNYFATFQRYNTNTGTVSTGYIGDSTINNYSTTSFSISRGFNGPVRWEVKGMSA